jgi:rhodanese-related sulfurtransferase
MNRSPLLSVFALFAVPALCALPLACAEAPAPAAPPAPAGQSAPAPAAQPAPAAGSVRNVDVAMLKADLDRGAVPLLIDVRSPEEFAAGHVASAKNIPLGEVEARLAEFGAADKEVYVICQAGGRSAKASATLASKGYHPVNVEGGTGAWMSAGYPVAQ